MIGGKVPLEALMMPRGRKCWQRKGSLTQGLCVAHPTQQSSAGPRAATVPMQYGRSRSQAAPMKHTLVTPWLLLKRSQRQMRQLAATRRERLHADALPKLWRVAVAPQLLLAHAPEGVRAAGWGVRLSSMTAPGARHQAVPALFGRAAQEACAFAALANLTARFVKAAQQYARRESLAPLRVAAWPRPCGVARTSRVPVPAQMMHRYPRRWCK